MKKYVKVRIKTPKKSSLLLKLNNLSVSIRNIVYEKDYLVFEIIQSDIKRIKKYLVSYKLEIIENTGIYKYKDILKKNSLFIVGVIFSIIIFNVLTNIIVKVNVIHEDSDLRNLIYSALEEKGVKNISFKKSYDEYEKIIEDIKSNYKDKIEWLEIDVEGMIINIRVEERIIKKFDNEYNYCHIVASKSGIIRNVITTKGVSEVLLNEYVAKGDILINGMIKLNEEVKNNVCATGEVYAEVWYNAHASVPLEYEEIKKTGKMRLNFMVRKDKKDYQILKSRVKEKSVKNILLFKIFGFEFYIQKEYEVIKNVKKYNMKEAEKRSIEIIHEKLKIKNKNIEIINEKVLKKNLNNGNLDIDMFIAIKEQIGVRKYYKLEDLGSDTDDKEHNGGNNRVR